MDDATEGYLKEDIVYAQSVLNKTEALPESTGFRFYYLGVDTLSEDFKLAIKSQSYTPYYFWQTDAAVFYGVSEDLGDKTLYVFHKFSLEESIPGIQLESIVLGLVCLVLLLMMFFAAMIYQRISTAMIYLNRVSSDPNVLDGNHSEFTEINNIAQALTSSVTELEQKNTHERYFIQSLSHELRTPMAIIQAAVELLKKQATSSADNRLNEKLTIILNANLKMQSLANNLLSLWGSADQQGRSQVCLNEVVIKVVEELAHYYDIKERIKLCLPNESVIVNASLFAAQLVISNVIKNAVVHGEGVIKITLTDKHIVMTNQISCINNSGECVGMGLFIVEQGIECLGWQYQRRKDELYKVEIKFSE